ncbi:SIMPL domain-containing protein [Bdellovibrio bacteriovorus]|uniref:SIMPL domain-containing protein n=1 Tax=Bdellovibrio bacteriovorus TaxID=959 RepID=UPI0035A90033
MTKIFAASLLSIALMAGVAHAAEDRLIIVNGVAEKGLDPNMVNLGIEVWSKASTAKQAQQLAANQYKHIKKTFDEYKIKKEDIQTDNYSLNPEYEYDQKLRQNKMTGFRVSQSLTVTLRKVEDAGNFLDSLVTEKKSMDSGTNVNSISWDSDKRSQVETAALGDAVRAAKMKAEEIAKAAGVKVKGVSKISHSTGHVGPQPVFRNYAMKLEAADSAPTEVSAGQIKVRVEVTAEYEIN